jgi:hypothetical protein
MFSGHRLVGQAATDADEGVGGVALAGGYDALPGAYNVIASCWMPGSRCKDFSTGFGGLPGKSPAPMNAVYARPDLGKALVAKAHHHIIGDASAQQHGNQQTGYDFLQSRYHRHRA